MTSHTASQKNFMGANRNRRLAAWQLAIGLIFTAVGCSLLWFNNSSPRQLTSLQFTKLSRHSPKSNALFTKPIEMVEVGDRVLGENPLGDWDDTLGDIDPATWRRVVLLAPKEDGGEALVTLLRSTFWLDSQNADTGKHVFISVPECGIDGNAEILAITPCPHITDGPGHVVTGTFQHPATHLINISVDGQETPITSTPNHPFWSEDRQQFVRADALTPGERLRASDQLCPVAFISHLEQPAPVFNLEVHGTHVYRVGTLGILVHNGQPCSAVLEDMLRVAQEASGELRGLNKALASAPDGSIFVSGAGVFKYEKTVEVLGSALQGQWVRATRDKIGEVLTYFSSKGQPIAADLARDFALQPGGRAVAGSYNASHAELQAAFEMLTFARTTAERAKLLVNGELVINIGKLTGPPGPCPSCQTLLKKLAHFENVPIRVNWLEGGNPKSHLAW
jgi:hypothetical protein